MRAIWPEIHRFRLVLSIVLHPIPRDSICRNRGEEIRAGIIVIDDAHFGHNVPIHIGFAMRARQHLEHNGFGSTIVLPRAMIIEMLMSHIGHYRRVDIDPVEPPLS